MYMTKTRNSTYETRYFQERVDARTRQIRDLDMRIMELERLDRECPLHPSGKQELARNREQRSKLQKERMKYLTRLGRTK